MLLTAGSSRAGTGFFHRGADLDALGRGTEIRRPGSARRPASW
jgi:hypothetical protein